MREGSLEAPTRHILAGRILSSTTGETEAEMERVFDICHTCRRCFNLCDSFPRLFDLIDNSSTGELDSVDQGFQASRRCLHAVRHVLHDEVPLCAAARVQRRFSASDAALPRGRGISKARFPLRPARTDRTDRNGKLAAKVAPLANWASDGTTS
jgi:glycerol-3-phosphate dehydrogenase subunit C